MLTVTSLVRVLFASTLSKLCYFWDLNDAFPPCRSVQAGVYPNVLNACNSIISAAGVRGLFTGYLPTLLEDVPDMAFKFAAYESMRSLRLRLVKGRKATPQVQSAPLSPLPPLHATSPI